MSASSSSSFRANCYHHLEQRREPARRLARPMDISRTHVTSRPERARQRIKEIALRQSFPMGSERWYPICEKELTLRLISGSAHCRSHSACIPYCRHAQHMHTATHNRLHSVGLLLLSVRLRGGLSVSAPAAAPRARARPQEGPRGAHESSVSDAQSTAEEEQQKSSTTHRAHQSHVQSAVGTAPRSP